MKFICEKENLNKGLNSVIKAVAMKTTMPILEGILIQTEENNIKLTAYDTEIGIEYIFNAQIKEHGSIVVNAVMFNEIIKKLPNVEIKIHINENSLLVIDCEGSLYKLTTMLPEDFPELPKVNIEKSIAVEQKTLKELIRKTIFAVSSEENKPIFKGCLFEIKNNILNVVAIDGFRLAWNNIKIKNTEEVFSVVIPGKTLLEINKILNDTEDLINISISKNQALFELKNCKITTRLLDGEFLNYSSVIPNNWETRIIVNKNNLIQSFERISLISLSSLEKEKKYPVKVVIEIGKMTLFCTNQTGDAKEEMYITTEGKNLEIGFNPKYFLDALKVIEEEELYIEFGTNIAPCVVKPMNNSNFTYMILPIKLKEQE